VWSLKWATLVTLPVIISALNGSHVFQVQPAENVMLARWASMVVSLCAVAADIGQNTIPRKSAAVVYSNGVAKWLVKFVRLIRNDTYATDDAQQSVWE